LISFLGEIAQPAHTYNVMGNANEVGVVIGETTHGGLAELTSKTDGAPLLADQIFCRPNDNEMQLPFLTFTSSFLRFPLPPFLLSFFLSDFSVKGTSWTTAASSTPRSSARARPERQSRAGGRAQGFSIADGHEVRQRWVCVPMIIFPAT